MNYIKYDSPEWKKISQCLVRLGIYGNNECGKAAYVYNCNGDPAIERDYKTLTQTQIHRLADKAIALLREKYPEYKWKRKYDSVIRGVKR